MRILVIGSGLAGLTAALRLRETGHRVDIISKGLGGLLLSTGTLDAYGWSPEGEPIVDPYAAIDALADTDHPYAHIGSGNVRAGIEWLTGVTDLFSTPPEHNVLLPTAAGAVRPSAVVQKSTLPLADGQKLVVVGLRQFKDFPATLIADNLSRSPLVDVEARAVTIDVTARDPEVDSTGTTYARALAQQELRDELARALRSIAEADEILLLPAVLGLDAAVYADLSAELGVRISEVPVPPPSVAGRRINDELVALAKAARIDLAYNAQVVGFTHENGHITSLEVQRAGRITSNKVDAVVYAGGGFESGSLTRDADTDVYERTFNLPVIQSSDLFSSRIAVDSTMRPVDETGACLYDNLYLAGSILGGCLPWVEKSGEGIALGSAFAAVAAINSEGEGA